MDLIVDDIFIEIKNFLSIKERVLFVMALPNMYRNPLFAKDYWNNLHFVIYDVDNLNPNPSRQHIIQNRNKYCPKKSHSWKNVPFHYMNKTYMQYCPNCDTMRKFNRTNPSNHQVSFLPRTHKPCFANSL